MKLAPTAGGGPTQDSRTLLEINLLRVCVGTFKSGPAIAQKLTELEGK